MIQLVSNLIEANGRTVRQNNLAIEHDIPLRTLVEVLARNDHFGLGSFAGVRAYVIRHERDCDGTPLYGLQLNRDFMEENAGYESDPQLKAICNLQIEGGFSRSSLQIVDQTRDAWPRVPPVGTYVVADHPITPGNPHFIFCVKEVKSESGKVHARGEKTFWFHVNMLRPPTPEEAADIANYNPEEL